MGMIMEETLMNGEHSETAKIKTHHARIVVGGTAEKPCYSIEWFDPTKNEYFLGYSSYYIANVFNWLSECFEIVEAAKTNADRIRAMSDENLAYWIMCPYDSPYCDGTDHNCIECTKEWLQQPAEELKDGNRKATD